MYKIEVIHKIKDISVKVLFIIKSLNKMILEVNIITRKQLKTDCLLYPINSVNLFFSLINSIILLFICKMIANIASKNPNNVVSTVTINDKKSGFIIPSLKFLKKVI